MTPLTDHERQRLLDLLADRALGQLELEERAELESLAARAEEMPEVETVLGELLVAADAGSAGEMPADVRQRLIARGRALVGGGAGRVQRRGLGIGAWLALAACLVVVVAAGMVLLSERNRSLERARAELQAMRVRVEENGVLLAAARSRAEQLEVELAGRDDLLEEERRRIAEAARREIDLAERLAQATANLDQAELKIARYEQPEDPAVLAENRRKLLEVPNTIRVAWSDFDVPDNPAEQQGVQGDVVWNDELQQGYMRFVGLKPNDPEVEQYQVWVIDERGMEQKVGGGVFNATAQGEVIVPIEPGIDVGRVAVFAVTIEKPGGTWVPDLKRRVVVGQRGEG